ncbi:MAG: PAS domain-containing protein [Deltaproteobacteria bacterium]|nr:PAS domain-containing protein [Deltaproteobacteria bacterium]
MINLDTLFENLLSSGFKLTDPETIRKVKVLNIFQLVFIMMAPIVGLFYFYVGAIFLFYVVIIAGLLMGTSIVLLRKTKSLVYGGNYAILILWGTFLVIAWNTGAITFEGVIRPIWIINGSLILFAIFLNGYQWGTIWTTVVFVETGLIIYLFRNGYLFPNLIPPDISPVYSLGTYLVALLAILLFAFLFEKERSEALMREHGKSQALRESKKYIDDILDRSPIPTFILDRHHRVIQWNLACREMTGLKSEEVLGKDVWEGFYIEGQESMADIILEDKEAFLSKYEKSIVSKTDTDWLQLEVLLPNMDEGRGKRVLISAAPIMDNDGTVRGAIQTTQEVKSIGAAGNGAFAQADGSIGPVFKIDSQGRISFWNQSCEETFGYPSSQMIGRNALGVVAKSYKRLLKDTIVRTLNGESLEGRALKFYDSDKKPTYVLVRAFPAQSAAGTNKECVFLATDVTDLRLRIKKLQLFASESKENLKNLTEEYDLLKKNIATFIRKKEE